MIKAWLISWMRAHRRRLRKGLCVEVLAIPDRVLLLNDLVPLVLVYIYVHCDVNRLLVQLRWGQVLCLDLALRYFLKVLLLAGGSVRFSNKLLARVIAG